MMMQFCLSLVEISFAIQMRFQVLELSRPWSFFCETAPDLQRSSRNILFTFLNPSLVQHQQRSLHFYTIEAEVPRHWGLQRIDLFEPY